MIIAAFAALAVSCGKQEEAQETDPTVGIEVSGLADNNAVVTVKQLDGKFYGAKLVPAVLSYDVEIDYTQEMELIKWVRTEGVDIKELPYSHSLTKLKAGKDYVSAAVIFDKTGRVSHSACIVWTAEGTPNGVAVGNGGDLGNNEW